MALPFDVRDAEATEASIAALEAEFGPLTGLVTAAGLSRPAPAESMDEATWDLVVDTNLKGMFLSCQAAGRRMLAQGGGAIVNIGSVNSLGGFAGRSNYCSAKFGVSGLTEVLAIEWGRRGIRVNAVAPNGVDTPLVRKGIPPRFVEEVLNNRTPLGRMAQPGEIAAMVLFLSVRRRLLRHRRDRAGRWRPLRRLLHQSPGGGPCLRVASDRRHLHRIAPGRVASMPLTGARI